jgi:hypothetical protein
MSEPRITQLPEWARNALEAPFESDDLPSIRAHREGSAWPLFVQAATMSSFLPRDLGAGQLSGAEQREAQKAVLRHAELSSGPGGARWALRREARREVLSVCEPAEIAGAVERGEAQRADPVSAAMRELLAGKSESEVQSLSIPTLEAMRVAASWLKDVPGIQAPTVEQLEGVVALRRILAPFERMTGKTSDDASPRRRDRFFGRTDEIEALREHVGVIEADTARQGLGRLVKVAKRVLFTGTTNRAPLNVWGTGGVGKTTLIAKFMLEHARAAAAKFPFAYLDFDRSTVSAANRAGLLIEIFRQVGAQFPDLGPPMQSLCERVAQTVRSMPPASAEYISVLMPFAAEFRQTIDGYFTNSAPLLLVFDTFEVVQYSRDHIESLQELVQAFNAGEPSWPRLRLIISGRGRVDDFLGEVEHRELGALDRKGSAEMLEALADDAGKPISIAEADRLVGVIAAALRDPTNDGVRPLRLRIIGELFAKGKESGSAIVQSLLDELAKPSEEQRRLGALLVDGILVRRILEHIRDPRVRALADPGLVVRRVTKDIIREVMTRGTSRDAVVKPVTGDPEVIEPWIVDDAEAQDIYDAFTREVTIVDVEGMFLKHRQDVRRDMLPLLTFRRNAFQRIHRLAYQYFRSEAEKDPQDERSRAEAVYHGLWLDEPLAEVDRLWPAGLDPAIDPDEFPSGSLANVYLRAKRKHALTAAEVKMLPRPIAVAWLATRGEELLSTVRVLPEIPIVLAACGDDYATIASRSDVAAMVARLLYRAGLWDEAMRLLRRLVSPGFSVRGEVDVSLIRTYATIAAKGQAPETELRWLTPLAANVNPPIAGAEILAHATLGLPRLGGFEQAVIDPELQFATKITEVTPVEWRREPRILRLVLATGMKHPRVLAETFVGVTGTLPRDTTVAAILSHMTGRTVTLDTIDEVWDKQRNRFVEDPAMRRGLCALAAADHTDWLVPLGNAITRSFEQHRKRIMQAVRDVVPDKKRYAEIERIAKSGDGHSLLQHIVAEGALMQFAERLAAPAKRVKDPESVKYPETAFEMAAALVRWHRLTTLKELSGAGDGAPPNPKQQPPRA